MRELGDSLCEVPGIAVGHAQDDEAETGCTVILPEGGAVAGVDVRGSSPGTREIELLKPVRQVERIHAILLTGGSAFGLDAAGGVQQYLEERGIGYDVGVAKVPLVPTAVVFDLAEGDPRVRPDRAMGYRACGNATRTAITTGRVGVGRGATVGKILGHRWCMKGGLGSASVRLPNGVTLGAIVVVNALGDVVDPTTGRITAGARNPHGEGFVDTVEYLKQHPVAPFARLATAVENTTLAVVATDARLTKEQVTKVAQMGQNGIAKVVRPAHSPYDGDIVFALSVGEKQADLMTLGALAAELVALAIVRAVTAANGSFSER